VILHTFELKFNYYYH